MKDPGARSGGSRGLPANAGQSMTAALTAVSWTTQQDLGLGEWSEQGRRLGSIGRAAAWWIGDWLRYGNLKWGERYVRASRITGYDVQTLMNMAYVASRFEISQRREKLTWSHHAELAAVEASERDTWLDRVEQDRLSVRCLRDQVRRARVRPDAATPSPAAKPHVVCPECGCRFNRGVDVRLGSPDPDPDPDPGS